MAQQKGVRVAALLTDGFQEVEFVGPQKALTDAGAQVDIISDRPSEVQAFDNFEPTKKYQVTKTIKKYGSMLKLCAERACMHYAYILPKLED